MFGIHGTTTTFAFAICATVAVAQPATPEAIIDAHGRPGGISRSHHGDTEFAEWGTEFPDSLRDLRASVVETFFGRGTVAVRLPPPGFGIQHGTDLASANCQTDQWGREVERKVYDRKVSHWVTGPHCQCVLNSAVYRQFAATRRATPSATGASHTPMTSTT